MRIRKDIFALILLAFTGCASNPVQPEWIHSSTRTVDNGYIVYIGIGEDRLLEKARFKADGEAIGDLVNECSFAPKGARVEDHFDEPAQKGAVRSYVRIGISFDECEQAKKTLDPAEIKNLASLPMAEALKRYQDLIGIEADSGDPSEKTADNEGEKGSGTVIHDNNDYYIVRQRLAWQKQLIIFAPTDAYSRGSPQYIQYNSYVTRVQPMVIEYEQVNPSFRDQARAWSSFRRTPTFQGHLRTMRVRPAAPPPVIHKKKRRRR